MHRLVFLIIALIAAIVFVVYAKAGVEEWNRGSEVADAIKEAYTGETKGKKVAQEKYYKLYFPHFHRQYRATFVYEVDGEAYQVETDTNLEPWDEEEVHYDPADPSKCYVGFSSRMEDDSGDYFGIAIVGLVIAIVFGATALGYF